MVRESPGGLEQSLAAARHEAAARQVPVALPGGESGRRFGEEILTHPLIVPSLITRQWRHLLLDPGMQEVGRTVPSRRMPSCCWQLSHRRQGTFPNAGL